MTSEGIFPPGFKPYDGPRSDPYNVCFWIWLPHILLVAATIMMTIQYLLECLKERIGTTNEQLLLTNPSSTTDLHKKKG